MNPIFTILIVLILIATGFTVYQNVPFNYTPNIPPLLNISYGELSAIKNELNKANLNEQKKQELINRREEIYNLLAQFFGKDIRNELV